jgi:predicted dehydrogenase
MALDPGEARSLAALARNRGRVLAVGHTAVYDLQFDSLRSGLRDLSVERLTAVRTSSGPSGSDGQPQVGNRQSRVIFDLCPHDIAMAVLLLGVPEAARAKNTATGVEYELRFDSETAMTGRAEWREPPHTRTFEVAYEHGTATVSGFSPSPLPARDTPLGRQCLDFITSCRERRRPRSDAKLGVDVARCLAAMNASCTDGHGWMPLRWGAE